MKYIALFVLLSVFAWGSKILTYNVYDRNDRVDVMLTFDTPYEGVLRQNQDGNQITIKLEQATLDEPILKNISSAYLNKLSITPNAEELLIVAQVADNVQLQASKTSDSYGLRLRFNNPAGSTSPLFSGSNSGDSLQTGESELPTKKGNEFEQSYYVVIILLVIGIAILFWLKQSIAKKASTLNSEQKSPWLFNASAPKQTINAPTAMTINNSIESGGVHVRFQKSLDQNHTVAMLDYGTQSYLVLLGNNTILLDKFQDNIPLNQNDFESMLQTKHRELDGFFQIPSQTDDTFDLYKEKASGVY